MTQQLDQKIPLAKSMTTAEVHSILAQDAGITKKQVEIVLESLPRIITDHLKQGLPISFLRMVKFYVREKKPTNARKVTNPFTGKTMEYPAKPATRVPAIKMLKRLKEVVPE